MNDYLDPINSVGMPELADSAIALEFLTSVKNGVRNCAIAITEAATPEVRSVLIKHLEQGIDLHGEVTELMLHKGWLYPYDVDKQMQLDIKSAETTVDIARLPLFPTNTNRKGLFPTPPK
ncbi:spore coat protein [Domibacillus sp. DTU_2020_1001157_1_SI_ALB_TIR_016]|uniref:spore coat protein n=1 Tax=Domibacillus sp. DTU_2020_1001157_1_SI_ALB_TIR_016 TaxID=3077789 RepID=UPI0028EED947|nr:spore coat protein [Domibacillus sp. DTU_2020_1001157_1_SI_ALB_TIR_016]WNS80204.1 spore coat protein [Domibacillus sp. DTU_2020_1001157_1_SI_ALB_TIR_016]